MPRDIRYIPQGGGLVEVTCVTIQNRYLLRPSKDLNDIVVGVIAYAQRKHDIEIVALAVMSTHFHLLLQVRDAQQLSKFMGLVNSQLSKEVGRLHRWPGAFWQGRYKMVLVSDEKEAQIARLEYCLAQGCKEGLVKRPEDWPGVHCARSLARGDRLAGHWYDRTAQSRAKQRLKKDREQEEGKLDPKQFATKLELDLAPLPCWKHLPETERRRLVAEILTRIEEKTTRERRATKSRVVGTEAIQRAHPHQRAADAEKRMKPRFHTATKAAWQKLQAAYAEVYQAYRRAAELLKKGFLENTFPEGTFPPARPFLAFSPG